MHKYPCPETQFDYLLTALQVGPGNFKNVAVPSVSGMGVRTATSCFRYMGQLRRRMVCHAELLST